MMTHCVLGITGRFWSEMHVDEYIHGVYRMCQVDPLPTIGSRTTQLNVAPSAASSSA